jgi:beta-glucosidase
MCGYNKVNGEYACANDSILNKDLREKLNFTGYVLSDWNATRNGSLPGMNIDMEQGSHYITLN